MRRILSCSTDAYITTKIINNNRATGSNTGNAASLDCFKLYNETYFSGTTNPIELSRLFVKFDLNPLRSLTGSILNLNDSSFKSFLSLKDVYGGQSTPSNFNIILYPLAQQFSEGRGIDVVGYRDSDAVNWTTASIVNGTPNLWISGGCSFSGNLGTPNLDYYLSGNFGSGLVPLSIIQNFARGDENLSMDITSLVSATLVGLLPDYGYRVSFLESEETDTKTRFVKRFASRHIRKIFQRPKLDVFYNDSFIDQTLVPYLDYSSTIGVYNTVFGSYRNFYSGSTQITGSNSLKLTLVASRSVPITTTTWSIQHSATISYISKSTTFFSTSFSASQYKIGSNDIQGIYTSSFYLDTTNATLSSYLGNLNTFKAQPLWQSLDGTITYSSGSFLKFKRLNNSLQNNVAERNFVMNTTNLKEQYIKDETSRIRVFIRDYNTEIRFDAIPIVPVSQIYSNVHWRLLEAYTREIIIPFDLTYNSTKLSSDGEGMYFDLYMNDLPTNQVYEIEFLIRENGQDYLQNETGFRFKVIP